MKRISLTQGKYALVDDKDFAVLSEYPWHYSQGYAARMSPKPQRKIFLHRSILMPPNGMFIDHINGDSLDNRRENLRICTRAENQHNQKILGRSTSGFKGVSWHKRIKKWNVKIRVAMKDVHLGYFTEKVEAARAYNEGAKKYYGAFACLNPV